MRLSHFLGGDVASPFRRMDNQAILGGMMNFGMKSYQTGIMTAALFDFVSFLGFASLLGFASSTIAYSQGGLRPAHDLCGANDLVARFLSKHIDINQAKFYILENFVSPTKIDDIQNGVVFIYGDATHQNTSKANVRITIIQTPDNMRDMRVSCHFLKG